MPLAAQAAIQVLSHAAQERGAGSRLQDRLREVQGLLGEDLKWVERELNAVAQTGPTPANDAAVHLVKLGGKRVRPLALLLSAACTGGITEAARQMAVVSELVHSATLLHDDVIDEGLERRGATTSRRLWGNGISVLSGDLLLVHALDRTHAHAPELLGDLIQTLRRLVDGEVIQMRGRTELDVSEATYERILRDKTASLFAWAARTGARINGASEVEQRAFAEFGDLLGMSFQLVDDVLDYSGQNTGKNLLADLKEGKLTLPLVLAVARDPSLVEPLTRVHAGDQEPVERLKQAVLKSGVCAEVYRRAKEYTRRAVGALDVVRETPPRALLIAVAEELATRAG